ncbi:amino acid/amide ABC transporter substrate-binding protein (HAAT family) [Acidovorax sp. 69]|uniref:ABC transporter substrate-binding protein n=1 Tax=Acidovorax sp. 69 TaxID=2035202 RepID=UPI000C23FFAB|nr:ABC transporter substrate-binding protein [Acidovorax sp. 69]PJI95305.1 amino acid/amide ABC transporter substrate-binding protein (HAAT family) [Acidovorax sp. 69]
MQRRQFVTLASHTTAVLAAPVFMRNAWAQEGGITGKTLTIGCSAALSGPLAGFGQDIKQGAEAALAHINGRGGVHGRTLQFNMVDDGYVPQRTTDNIKQIIGQGSAFALLSCVGTPNNTAILPLIEEAGIPYVAPLTGASSLRKGGRNVFHVRASYTDEVRRLVQRLAGMGLKGIGVVYLDNGYGREMLEDATRSLAEQNIKPSVQAALATDGKNLADVLAKVAEARPAAVLLATAGSASIELVRGIKKTVPGVLMAGVSVTLTSDGLKQLGDAGSGIAVTMVMPDPNRAKTQLVRDYQAAMRAKGQPDFTLGSLEAYVNMRVLAEGLERAGSDPSRAKLRTALAGIRNWDMGGFVVDYSGQSPYVGSRFIDLGVLNGAGRFLG